MDESTGNQLTSITINIDDVKIKSYHKPATLQRFNVIILTTGCEYLIPFDVNVIVVDTDEHCTIYLPSFDVDTVTENYGMLVSHAPSVRVVRIRGEHSIKCSYAYAKISTYLPSVHLNEINQKYEFIAVPGGWVTF